MLENKVAVITGSSRGIGAAIAELFAKYGAKVVINYLSNQSAADEIVQKIQQFGGEAVSIQADVRDVNQMNRLAEQTVKRFGKIDVFVNNASILFPLSDIAEMQWGDFQNKLVGEIQAAFIGTQAIAPFMIKQKYGKLLFISSGLSKHPAPGFVAHGTAKGALNSLVQYIAQEYAKHNITANVLSPGMVATEGTEHLSLQEKENIAAGIPLGKIADPIDIANVALTYASEYTNFCTGIYVPISGGVEMNS
ncbi:short-chain dehydrogenase [Paenibacillus sp. PCH8]|uniref:SDR family NAD(P)-dependent oxidoreductase n=1 Tax=Paenibacillus sp. PCH8 TaxID=2066524 RepID=UPI000CFA7638|nr:SDR family oxidoreductase [Paenibacillus sp. PCH8]PQP81016.1 short-chain dehydrogenase [Paenibacillus sp. PCH8]